MPNIDKYQAIHNFWSSFGLPTYHESRVPESAGYPRLTYSVSVAGLDEPVLATASLWYYSNSWEDISQKSQEIYNAIGIAGKIIPFDGGYLWVKRNSPFSQRMADENDAIRRVLISVTYEFLVSN